MLKIMKEHNQQNIQVRNGLRFEVVNVEKAINVLELELVLHNRTMDKLNNLLKEEMSKPKINDELRHKIYNSIDKLERVIDNTTYDIEFFERKKEEGYLEVPNPYSVDFA